jgi:hypothetical protein
VELGFWVEIGHFPSIVSMMMILQRNELFFLLTFDHPFPCSRT